MLLGLSLLVGAKWMPRRTATGAALRRRVRGFRTYIATAETHASRWAEEETVFTRFLPYAIVFGLTDKRTKAFADVAGLPTVAWYASSHPVVVGDLADGIGSFAVTASHVGATGSGSGVTGTGGFSGGFSGGGAGGGGGGSW
jgi:uncharacterized membrane protein